jgi:phosphoribosylformylglycinamidine synthase
MKQNLELARCGVLGTVLLELAQRGVSREQATNGCSAMRCAGDEQKDFRQLLLADADDARPDKGGRGCIRSRVQLRTWTIFSTVRSRRRSRLDVLMRARVFVTLKPSVFDPQGKTIVDALHSPVRRVEDVRQGRLRARGGADSTDKARSMASEVADKPLANPVIELP